MLRIAVCDDHVVDLKMLEKMLSSYQDSRGEAYQFEWFFSSAELMQRLRNGVQYDIFILDMIMPEYNGVEVGRAIRADGMDSAIIYITASPDFALDAISVHPEQYLLKPLDPGGLYHALDAVQRRMFGRGKQCLSVKTRKGTEQLPCEEIVCVEHAGRVMRVYTQDCAVRESVYLRAPFETLVGPILQQPEFLQTHKSYLINMHHVRSLQQADFLMDTGMQVPVSRRNMSEVKRRYFQFTAD